MSRGAILAQLHSLPCSTIISSITWEDDDTAGMLGAAFWRVLCSLPCSTLSSITSAAEGTGRMLGTAGEAFLNVFLTARAFGTRDLERLGGSATRATAFALASACNLSRTPIPFIAQVTFVLSQLAQASRVHPTFLSGRTMQGMLNFSHLSHFRGW